MTDWNDRRAGGLLLLAAMLPASAAAAQSAPTPQETPRTIPGLAIPSPAQTPVPVPTEAGRGLPAPVPTPVATPRAAETPRAAPKPERATARPTPTPTPAPTLTPTPKLTPTSTPTALFASTPEAVVAPAPRAAPVVAASAPPSAPAAPPVAPPAASPAPARSWPWVAALALLAALAGWLLVRRRSAAALRPVAIAGPAPAASPPPGPQPVPVAPVVAPPAGPRAAIAVAVQPSRAGLNMLSAVVEATVVVTNTGAAPATDIRLHATLLSAHTGQDADLAAVFATPAGRPATPPFALAPGEERRVRVVAALPREGVRSMEAGGRPMFVPLLALDVRYAADPAGARARTGQAFVVGIERVDSAKLAPFWLDAPLKMHDQIAARAQGPAIAGGID